ncbi:unnamed protein product [Phaedon cochleariae]|uniref:Uncharacterized protein n=1 Tax=Phaedon cochleariae TaxID=80249 RepID=A0A9N9SI34_PHACE|nr:unnamed protein product [Phaedon cochleariae]
MDRSYRSDDTEDAMTTDNPTTPFPTPPPSMASPRSPIPLHRQASPFPLENINTRRIHYQTPQDRIRGNNGEIIYASGNKKNHSNSTLNRRRHRGMISSSSANSCNSCSDNMSIPNGDLGYPEQNKQHRISLNNVIDVTNKFYWYLTVESSSKIMLSTVLSLSEIRGQFFHASE